MKKHVSKGFTLIELAVVIAVIAILAAVAIPRLTNASRGAERSVALDFVSQLNSAAAMYTAANGRVPTVGFTQFVTTTNPPPDPFVISTATLGQGGCTIAAGTITCASAFPTLGSVTYTWTNGSITHNIPAS